MPEYVISNSTVEDIEDIFSLYDQARIKQGKYGAVLWPTFDRKMVMQEIMSFNQWKVVIANQMMCEWATTFSDAEIWGPKNFDKAVYIHRLATNPNFSGNNFALMMTNWAIEFAREKNLDYVRMDTVNENLGLIKHYQKCGFSYLGLKKLTETENLPAHYHNATVSLFELDVNQ